MGPFSQGAKYTETIATGQHNIQDDDIVMLIQNDLESLVSAIDHIDHEPELFQTALDKGRDLLFILDN
jgi:hypothetical protein